MRILGLDLGTQTLGIAVSDETELIASGVENFNFKPHDYEAAYHHLEGVISRYQVKIIVIGLPYHLSGEESKAVERVRKFKEGLVERFKLPVEEYDERWTTKIAHSYMLEADLSRKKRKEKIDMLSAVIILQDYLDRRKQNG